MVRREPAKSWADKICQNFPTWIFPPSTTLKYKYKFRYNKYKWKADTNTKKHLMQRCIVITMLEKQAIHHMCCWCIQICLFTSTTTYRDQHNKYVLVVHTCRLVLKLLFANFNKNEKPWTVFATLALCPFGVWRYPKSECYQIQDFFGPTFVEAESGNFFYTIIFLASINKYILRDTHNTF